MARSLKAQALRDGLPVARAAPAGPPGGDLLRNARECPHRQPFPPDERQGCGCSHRCEAGHGNMPNGGTDVANCWDCPDAPRRSW